MRAMESVGSRQPGLLVIGWACLVLHKEAQHSWIVEEGLNGTFWSRGHDILEMAG